MPPSRCIKLTEEEDNQLREIEQDSYLKPKVRLRAQVLRLSNRGSNIRAIASYTGRSRASIARDLDRWRRWGSEGLADGSAPGNPPRITQKARRYMEERLTEERTWNATQLAEALKEEFSVVVSPEAVPHCSATSFSIVAGDPERLPKLPTCTIDNILYNVLELEVDSY